MNSCRKSSNRFWFIRMHHNCITQKTPNKTSQTQQTQKARWQTFHNDTPFICISYSDYRENTGNWAPVTISLHPFSPRNIVVWLKYSCLSLVRPLNVYKVVLDGKYWPSCCNSVFRVGIQADRWCNWRWRSHILHILIWDTSTIIFIMSHPSYFT